ncbi:hypothetical protein RF11_15648 [Thelohanellus kitauei]|uniref:Uncharacterized protein n=1 Tax=Thelohanellus kitauei TaxID=669202 RepID=A0A0C2NA72_THEKT|nr:hypothetical protein RF11_07778 [Thelohanellus kitauei]KII70817.1 hypothetical protein RF11_15648 [Thelohanellus kitauei]
MDDSQAPKTTTRGYTTAVDFCFKSIKDKYVHRNAFEESRRVAKYPEGKRAFSHPRLCLLISLDREREQTVHTFHSSLGAHEEPALKGLAIPWIMKSWSRLICD